MRRTRCTPQLVDRAASVQLFLRFPWCCLRCPFVGNLNVSNNGQPMKASEGALESSYRAVSGLDAGWVRGGVLGDTALRPIRVFVSELDVLAIPYG